MVRAAARVSLFVCLSLVAACAVEQDAAQIETVDEVKDTTTVMVEVSPLAGLVRPLSLTAPASVLAPNQSTLSSEIGAPVRRVHVDVGSIVSEGELLVELDATDANLALAQAQARLTAAEARAAQAAQRLERSRTLADRGFVADDELTLLDAEWQSARAEADVAEADRRVAARNVEKCRLRAPFAGVVVERHAQLGALAVAGTPLLRVVDLAPPEIEVHLQEQEAERIGQGEGWLFESQGRHLPGRLLRVVPVLEPSARTRLARFGFVDEPAAVGSSGRLRWELPARQLPPRLLVKRDDLLGLFVAIDGHARFVAVTGASEGRPFEIDLPAHSHVIVDGHQALNDGDPIRTAEAAD